MDPLTTSLINSGGLGILAAVLLYLHISQQRTFREQQKDERELFRTELREERETCEQRHDAVMEKLSEIQATWR